MLVPCEVVRHNDRRMIDAVLTFTLRTLSERGAGKIDVYQTVFVHGHTATATIALSATGRVSDAQDVGNWAQPPPSRQRSGAAERTKPGLGQGLPTRPVPALPGNERCRTLLQPPPDSLCALFSLPSSALPRCVR